MVALARPTLMLSALSQGNDARPSCDGLGEAQGTSARSRSTESRPSYDGLGRESFELVACDAEDSLRSETLILGLWPRKSPSDSLPAAQEARFARPESHSRSDARYSPLHQPLLYQAHHKLVQLLFRLTQPYGMRQLHLSPQIPRLHQSFKNDRVWRVKECARDL
jgi:hypothetical protein